MSGVFSVLADAQAGMFRLQQAKKPWEKEIEAKDAKGQLAQKAERAANGFQLSAKQQRDHATAKAALEEAQRVGGPKAAAEQRLERVERKIEELKLAMRYAHGDRQKLAQLAREAALLAKEAGKAAKEYAVGVANAAEMGLPGGAGLASGSSSETTRTTTVTSLTIRQTEVSVTLTVSAGTEDAGPDSAAEAAAKAESAGAAQLAAGIADGIADGGEAASAPGSGEDLPPELARLVDGALSGLGGGNGLTGTGDRARDLMRSMMADNDLKMSRFKEADGFGRRVEGVLHVAKQVLGEAKVANAMDESEKRRKERREGFKADEKMIDEAQKEVNALRQAAFGSSIGAKDALTALDEALTEGPGGGETSMVAGAGATAGVAAGAAASPAGPAVNLLA